MIMERERFQAKIYNSLFRTGALFVLEDDLLKQRLTRIREIEALGYRGYGRRYEFTHTVPAILAEYSAKSAEELVPEVRVRIAGRLMTLRHMGKAGFAHVQHSGERLQIYVKKDAVGERDFALFKLLDIGDIVGVEGYLFRTRTGELSIHADTLEFLCKTLLSMPEKWHGLEDVETRYRQRYLDLLANPAVRQVFVTRARIVSSLRRQLEAREFIEVETPMMQQLYGGATARPFVTHHNTLDIDLYLQIAPELYLKRLVVGGMDRVYEINRNFRNEGLSTHHNPEFTMLEFYQAYTDYRGLMDFSEELLRQAAKVDLATLEFHHRRTRGVDRRLAQQLLGEIDQPAIVRVRLVELQHGELGVVMCREPFVAEVAVDLVHPVHAAHHQPLQIEFRRDAQVQIDVQRIVVRHEGTRRGPAVERLHHRRLHFDELARFQLPAQRRNDPRPGHKHLAHVAQRHQSSGDAHPRLRHKLLGGFRAVLRQNRRHRVRELVPAAVTAVAQRLDFPDPRQPLFEQVIFEDK